MKKRLPFVPFPIKTTANLAKPFRGIGEKIENMFPFLGKDLEMSNLGISKEVYSSIIAFSFVFYFIIFTLLFIFVLGKILTTSSIVVGIVIPHYILIGILIGFAVAFLFAIQMVAYPKIQIKKRIRAIESNLVFALRAMLVQMRSGVSLFNSLSMITNSKRFGELGIELKKAVDLISTGTEEQKALQEVASKNPSPYLRKVIWQITNGMKAGADISDVLAESVSSIVREQEIGIEKYGSSLRILSLMYLMIGVIIPALGITFLIVIGSFPKIEISEILFWALLGALILAEFMFLGIIKSKRPNLMSD